MTLFKFNHRHGVGTLEYVVVVLTLMAVFMTMAYVLPRVMAGRWKAAADTFGMGRQFDPSKTLECGYFEWPSAGSQGAWYNMECFKREYDLLYISSCARLTAVQNPLKCEQQIRRQAAAKCLDRKCCDSQNDPACRVFCGNGIQESPEDCDDGNINNYDSCLDTCRAARCGDGFVRIIPWPGEQCDDGNTTSGDGCSSSCQRE